MGLFTLNVQNGDISKAILEKTKTDSIDYEKDFENWLENSPNVLFEDDEMNSVIWIGRQPTAKVGESGKIPDLIGIDSTGDWVVVELKKGKTPRDVVAQILYASWCASLDYAGLDEIAQAYFRQKNPHFENSLLQVYREAFLKDNSVTTFKATEIIKNLKAEYPDMNTETIRCQITQDCVNHSSRKHYPSGQRDLYYRVEKGVFRVYDPSKDGKWNSKGEMIGN